MGYLQNSVDSIAKKHKAVPALNTQREAPQMGSIRTMEGDVEKAH
jgi:hypothetical protein